MSRNKRIIRLNNFSGGESHIYPYHAMPAKFSNLLQNCHIAENGMVSKVPGYTALNSSSCSATLTTGFEYKKSDGSSEILCAGGGSVFKVSGGSLSAIVTGLDTSAKVHFCQLNDVCIFGNGVDDPRKYNGTTVSVLGGTPPATGFLPHVHKNRVWWAERTNRMLASHSILNNGEDYTGSGSGYIDFRYVLPVGDELIDIKTYVDLIVFIFKNHIAIYSGSTPSGTGADFALVQLISGTGAVDSDVTLGLGTDLAIMDKAGIKALKQVVTTGNLNTGDISTHIDPVLAPAIVAGGSVASAHYPKMGWALFMLGTTVWVYSYVWKAWARLTGHDIKGMFTTSTGTLYLCGTNYLYQYDSGYSWNGTAIPFKWKPAFLSPSKYGFFSYPKYLEMQMNPDVAVDLTFGMTFDLTTIMAENARTISPAASVTAVDSISDFDAWDPIDELYDNNFRIPLFGRGKMMELSFSNSSTTGPINISSLALHLTEGAN